MDIEDTDGITYQAPGSTCSCHFSTSATYNGKAQPPVPVGDGISIYDEDEIVFTGINLKFAKADGITIQDENQTISKITEATTDFSDSDGLGVDFKGEILWTWAGTYTCKIEDTKSGQVICNNHKYTITPKTLTPVSISTQPTFEGKSVTYTATWNGLENGTDANGNPTYETFTATQASFSVIADGFTNHTSINKEFDITVPASKIALDTERQTDIDEFHNNYDTSDYKQETVNGETIETGSRATTGKYTVLATTYSYCSSATTKTLYHSSLNRALDATDEEATAATTVVAMQSFTYSTNSTTYSATAKTTGNYEHTIDGNHTVGANVTLLIPFRATTTFAASEEQIQTNDQYADDADGDGVIDDNGHSGNEMSWDSNSVTLKPTPTCVNLVTLNGKLTVYGKVDIAGLTGVSRPGASATIKQGMTSGKHAAIMMTGGSMSSNGSYDNYTKITLATKSGSSTAPTLRVRGYIASNSNYTWVEAQSGTIEMPFVVYDFGGGGATVALYKGSSGGALGISDLKSFASSNQYNVAPFNVFDMPNIQAELHCHSNATINGLASLFTNGAADILKARYNLTTIKIFGNTDALFTTTDGKAIFKYNADAITTYRYNPSSTTYYTPNVNTKTKITLDGATSSGDMAMVVNVPILGDVAVSLSHVKFPVSHKIRLYLTGSHDYTFSTSFKFLPGSELYIQNGAQVTVPADAGLMFYQSIGKFGLYNDTSYPATQRATPAICKITNATLTILGSSGGIIETLGDSTIGNTSLLNLSNASSLSMTETEGVGKYTVDKAQIINATLTFTFTPNTTYSPVTQGTVTTSETSSSSTPQNLTETTYLAYNSTSIHAWFKPTATVTLNANGGSFDDDSTQTTGILAVTQSGTTQSAIDSLPRPGRENHKFVGWYTNPEGTSAPDLTAIKFDGAATLYAKWEEAVTASISYTSTNKGNDQYVAISGSTSVALDGSFVPNLEDKNSNNPKYNYYLSGWTAVWTVNGVTVNKTYALGETINMSDVLSAAGISSENVTSCTGVLTADWTIKTIFTISGTNRTISITYDGEKLFDQVTTGEFYLKVGDSFIANVHDVTGYSQNTSFKIAGANFTDGNTYRVTSTGTIAIVASAEADSTGGGTCLAEGTLITLADGSKKAVEDLRQGDLVMAFDHLTGQIVYKDVIIVVKTYSDIYYKNTFIFDDGTELVTINEHGIFDLDLNKYVNIDHLNYEQYIGHRFVSVDTNGNLGVKTLVDVTTVCESGYKYDIVTNGTLNYVAEDTLSVTHVLVDIINTFDFGEDLTYDHEKMMADIELYGLYTYDEWEEYCDISVFDEYNIPIMHIGVCKGLYTKEYIISLINTYVLDDSVQIID